MGEHRVGPQDYRRFVLAYHGLPVLATLVLVGIFLADIFFTRSYLFSSLAAAVPFAFLMRYWVLAGRQIDRQGCPKCGDLFPKKMYWTYPPKTCPGCGERLRG
jgi:hypothetical protein